MLELHEEGVDLREDRGAVSLAFSLDGSATRVHSTRHSFLDYERAPFFEQAHVKDVASFLKFSINPRDEVAFKRVVRLLPGIGAKSAESLWSASSAILERRKRVRAPRGSEGSDKSLESLAATRAHLFRHRTAGPAAMIESVLFAVYEDYMKGKFANFDARREDLRNALRTTPGSSRIPRNFCSQLALLGAVETSQALASDEGDDEKVTLSTIHQAKGLEWSAVF